MLIMAVVQQNCASYSPFWYIAVKMKKKLFKVFYCMIDPSIYFTRSSLLCKNSHSITVNRSVKWVGSVNPWTITPIMPYV